VDSGAQGVIATHRRVWAQKPVLQRIYREEFFARLLAFCQPGPLSIEVGAGPGFLKQTMPGIISTDIVHSAWLDAVADAQHLPFGTGSATNILGIDVLHHFEAPLGFLAEAQRVLAPGGRLILIEPWVTPFSYVIYRYLHQEDCDLDAIPTEAGKAIKLDAAKRPFDGNQAIPYLLFGQRTRDTTLRSLPELTPIAIEPFCLFAYLLSFGFKQVSLLPEALYGAIAAFERRTLPLWRSAAALRVLLVLEKRAARRTAGSSISSS
jgi:SAM-dependent methyltransferase